MYINFQKKKKNIKVNEVINQDMKSIKINHVAYIKNYIAKLPV